MAAKQIPLELLFGNPERALGTVSPDGSSYAFVAPDAGVLNVWVGDVEGGEPRLVTNDRDRGIRSYWWTFDEHHLLYEQDSGGDENWHLYRVDIATGATVDLTPYEGVQAKVLALSPRLPHELLVGVNLTNPSYHDVYRVDLRTGTASLEQSNPGFGAWVVDLDLQVRGAVRPTTAGAGYELCVLEGGEWVVRESVGFDDAWSFDVLPVTDSPQHAYLLSSKDANASRLLRVDLASGGIEVLAEDADYDVGDVVVHPATGRPQIVGFLRDRLEHTVLDASLTEDLAGVEAIGPGELHLRGADLTDQRWIVEIVRDDAPADTYLFDRSTKASTHLFVDRPQLAEYGSRRWSPSPSRRATG